MPPWHVHAPVMQLGFNEASNDRRRYEVVQMELMEFREEWLEDEAELLAMIDDGQFDDAEEM